MAQVGTRLNRFLYETERHYPAATGELSDLLSQLAFAGKRISRILSSAGLTEILGASGDVNVQGEQQQKLDALANEVFLEAFAYGQLVPTIVTEEMDLPAHLPENVASGKYIVFLDPLDGSSNLDVNGGVGSIFSVRKLSGRGEVRSEAELMARISPEQVVAGVFPVRPVHVLVYGRPHGPRLHRWTRASASSSSPIRDRMPARGPVYGANEAASATGRRARAASSRVGAGKDEATAGRTRRGIPARSFPGLSPHPPEGGDLPVPGDGERPEGKIRLMYEAAPLALVAEAAGGAASDGRRRILDIPPAHNHERTPIYLGSRDDVARVDAFVLESKAIPARG